LGRRVDRVKGKKTTYVAVIIFFFFVLDYTPLSFSFFLTGHLYLFIAAGNVHFKSTPKQMSDSWIVIDDQDEADFVVIDDEHDKQQHFVPVIPSPKVSPQSKRPLAQNNNNKPMNMCQPPSGVKQNKKRKWKVLYSLPSTGVKANVDDSNLDSYVMDQHAQLFDKRDLFSSQQRIVKVK